MTLQEYFRQNATDRNKFAKEIGVDPITVYRWMQGSRFPRAHIQKITQATGGKVTANDFYPPRPSPDQPSEGTAAS